MDRLLVPANRGNLPLDKQLQQLLEKFDMTCAMKSSPSRSKRLKLLKKTINDVRNEMSLKRVLPSHHHASSTAPSTSAPSSSALSHPEMGKPKDERLKPNGHLPDDEGTCDRVVRKLISWSSLCLSCSLCGFKAVTCLRHPETRVRGQRLSPYPRHDLTEQSSHMMYRVQERVKHQSMVVFWSFSSSVAPFSSF